MLPVALAVLAFAAATPGAAPGFVDPAATPMRIVAEYDKTAVHANGFGGVEANGRVYINSGAGGEDSNPSQFEVYRFPLAGYAASNPPREITSHARPVAD
jgi:hypothetical protein